MNKKVIVWGMGLALTLGLSSPVQAEEIELTGSVGVDAASAYVFRGATVVDDWVLQPYGEIEGLPLGVPLPSFLLQPAWLLPLAL